MRFIDILKRKQADNMENSAATIAFLGDSVTQGCFEIYLDSAGQIQTVYDQMHGFHNYLKVILSYLYPSVPINLINAGISGDTATHAKTRLERDVIKHHPDLTVVCFALNDCMQGLIGLSDYIASLSEIFSKLKGSGSEIIFMTPQTMNTRLSHSLHNELERTIAESAMQMQNGGVLDKYISAAKKLCEENNIKVCDCYSKWKKLADAGVDTTELLANKINHPSREMNWLFAVSLFETILE